jgi:uncharacterized protein (DUF1697 family)
MAKPATAPKHYVAFLRGINVGGNKVIKMDALKAAFEKIGMKKVKTLLASGNVMFESAEADAGVVARKIETGLEKILGHKVGIVLRTIEELEALEKRNPFKGVTVTPSTRLWVTFLPASVGGKSEVASVIQLTGNLRQGMDLMADLDRQYGRSITTRSWSTVQKILKASTG